MADLDKVPTEIRSGLMQAIDANGWPLYLHGPPGTGKTCLAALLYSRWLGKAVWFSTRSLLLDLAAYRADSERQMDWFMPSGQTFQRPTANAWDDLTNPKWLVCLDDIGTRGLSDTQTEILLDLLDKRVGDPLIVTGNHGMEELRKILDPRIVSRLFAGTVICLTGKDHREPLHEVEVSNG